MKFLFFLFYCVCFYSYAWSQINYIPPSQILSKGGYQLGISGDYFLSTLRIDSRGNDLPFKNDESFRRKQTSIFSHYGLTENLQLGLGLRARQNQSNKFNDSTGEIEGETVSGLESTMFNALFSFESTGRAHYSVEGGYNYRTFSNEESGALILGDDGNEYFVNLISTYFFPGANFLSGKLGYRKPGVHLSDELNWQIEGALVWNKFSLLAGVEGINSLNNDPYDNDESSRPRYNTGSTLLYNSKNREMIAPYLGLNFSLGKLWRVEIKGSEVIFAQSYDKGKSISISLIKRLDMVKEKISPDKKFKDYDFEANVIKVSPKKTLVSLDKGISSDIQKGTKIDIFEFDYIGGHLLIASGVVIEVKAESSIVKITHHYNTRKELKEGLLGRGSYK
jgi:hypothetical protein